MRNLIDTRRLLRRRFTSDFELSPPQFTAGSLDEDFLQRVIDLFEQHMSEADYSVGQMSRDLLMSRMQFYRKLKALTGQTPNEFVRHIHLKRAAQLLETDRHTVAEVTYLVGFQDLKYFRERFREQFGVNPSEYGGGG